MDDARLAGDARTGSTQPIATVDLYWIPLGAGQIVVRASGKVFEAFSALIHQRPTYDLYHSALVVGAPEGRYAIEMAPIPDPHGERRGVVAEGPVGAKWAGRFRLFRYEVRCCPDGHIPDAHRAVSIVRMAVDVAQARRLIDLVPSIPTAVWGRDQLGTGDMWNSNSVSSWLLERSDIDIAQLEPPLGGRAPGWNAGLVVAARGRQRADRPGEGAGLQQRLHDVLVRPSSG